MNMRKRWTDAETKTICWFKEHILYILVNVTFGILVYFVMMANNLVNDMDGIWNTSHHIAGGWEISLGRGLLRYCDRLRLGIVDVPLNILFALLLFAVANALLTDLFPGKGKLTYFLMGFATIATPVMCTSLSFNYTAANYGVAYLGSVLAAYIACRCQKLYGSLLAGICLACSLACYQAYLGTACLVLLLYGACLIASGKGSDILAYWKHVVLTGICGAGFYVLITFALALKEGVQFSDYRGASAVSVSGIIKNLPSSFAHCYIDFFRFFFGDRMNLLSFKYIPLLWLVVIFVFLSLACRCISLFLKNIFRGVGYTICILLIPVACNAVLLIAVGNRMSLQMSMGMVLFLALTFVWISQETAFDYWEIRIQGILLGLTVWLGIFTVANDQLALLDGKSAYISIAENIYASLSVEGWLESQTPVALMGNPTENALFYHSAAYESANPYARFGDWTSNYYYTWKGVLDAYCGIDLPLCEMEQYAALCQSDQVALMPNYPKNGSICEIDGVIVVKVSDSY